MKILITGATGMLGSSMVFLCKNKYEITALGQKDDGYRLGVPYFKCDFSKDNFCDSFKKEIDCPDVIVHCAGIINHDLCNTDPELAYKVNADSTNVLMNCFPDSKMIYISTDAVFPLNTHMANELTKPSAVSVYGKSKEKGEKFALLKDNSVVVRTTIVGKNLLVSGNSLVEWILSKSNNNEEITLFDDVLFTPISTLDLIKELEFIIENGLNGIFHISGSEICTKYDFGVALLKKVGISNSKIIRSKMADTSFSKTRSFDQTLDVYKYQNVSNNILPNFADTIYTLKKSYFFKF